MKQFSEYSSCKKTRFATRAKIIYTPKHFLSELSEFLSYH